MPMLQSAAELERRFDASLESGAQLYCGTQGVRAYDIQDFRVAGL